MKDIDGNELRTGDRVAVCDRSKYSATMLVGVVVGFTPKQVYVEVTVPLKWGKILKRPDLLCKVSR